MSSIPLVAYSVADTAAMFGVSQGLIYGLIDSGDLPAVEFRARKLVPARAIDAVLDRAMDGFDPDHLIARLAATAGSSPAPHPVVAGDPTEPTGPTAMDPHSARHHRRSATTGGAPPAAVR